MSKEILLKDLIEEKGIVSVIDNVRIQKRAEGKFELIYEGELGKCQWQKLRKYMATEVFQVSSIVTTLEDGSQGSLVVIILFY